MCPRCPNCRSQIDHLIKIAYRDRKPKKKVKPGESKHVHKLNFCCPCCGIVIARSYKKARNFLKREVDYVA